MAPETMMAIQLFEKQCKQERRMERLTAELQSYLQRVPSEDINEYFRVTEEIRKKYEQ